MSNILSFTYVTFLAYIMPASIFLYLLHCCLDIEYGVDSKEFIVICFIALSVLVGFLFNALSTVVTSELFKTQQKRRDSIFFGRKGKRTTLYTLIDDSLPDEKTKIEYVYAIFNSHVPEHIYERRNWDWYFYQSSRNLLITSPFSISTLVWLAIRDTWPVAQWLTVFLSVLLILVILYFFASRQLGIYYGFYANTVVGYLLECRPEPSPSDE